VRLLEAVDDRLRPLLPLVRGIAELLGPSCEVVLHDLGEMPHTIVAIEHGHVTGRGVGDVPTDLMLRTLRRDRDDAVPYRVYTSTGKGRVLRCLSVPLRGPDGVAYGLLGINLDVTRLVQAQRQLSELTAVPAGPADGTVDTDEIFTGDIREVVDGMIAKILAEGGKHPAEMSRDEKMEVVKQLEERGAFLVKRAAEQVAEGLDLSRHTIFSYLKEIRRQSESSDTTADVEVPV
jgi:predicted transcriptional regulator YheO